MSAAWWLVPAIGVFRVTAGLYDEFGDDRVIDTPLTDGLNKALAMERGVAVAQIESERALPIPAGRPGTPDEVASACLFLLSRQASYCSGITLHPTGGVMAGAI